MNFETLLVESISGVTTVTLNRPEKLNAYTVKMGEELVDLFEILRDDDSCRSIVLTGSGRGFCAGVDLSQLREPGNGEVSLPKLGEERLVKGYAADLFHYPKPLIAAFNGAAIGVGVTMTLPFDVRIASSNAKFGLPFARLGIVPGLGSTYLLPRIIGPSNAKMLAMTGRTIDASTALKLGLVDQIVDNSDLLDTAREIAGEMGQSKDSIIHAIKSAINFASGPTSIEQAIAFEHEKNAQR
ncbi:enoyl-CoA hydratase/isomerase family protein [Parahaliea mediterranea]|uniref:Enoyl-CoA hydratase/isomerase family protein n=1 Tax=Parahaliea mediterranea TaxID=651086 RepID=A0A939DF57_9GAMM|nr:enoyl-CoA hydratase-related protein [Parahaliea mediterranea]MBN7796929.1 enoyl-CoA hydratase/isomerase family protein [Parahaliea mediterranea]